jgi:predicted nucleic acid-binding protein
MRIALDTNILAYAEGVGDKERRDMSVSLISRLHEESVVVPTQTLGELYRVLTRKAGRNPAVAREAILGWSDCFHVVDSTWGAFQSAMDLSNDHGLQIWDALILSVSAENHCRLLLSEDLHNGFTWRGVTVVNPFATKPHPLLQAALSGR